MGELLHGDEGMARKGLLLGLGVVAVTGLTAGALIANNFLNFFPDQQPDADNSKLVATQLALDAINVYCPTSAVYDTSGSTGHTVMSISGVEVPIIGRGVDMIHGKVIKKTCINGGGISSADVVEDGKTIKLVSIDRDAITQDVQFSEADTEIIPVDAPATQVASGIVAVASGSGRALCEGVLGFLDQDTVTIPGLDITVACDDLNFLADALNIEQQKLDRTFRVEVLKFVQTDCAAAGWSTEWVAVQDSFEQKISDEGGAPDLMRLQIVDDSGAPTPEQPEFNNDSLQRYYDQGILTEEVDGAIELEFGTRQCEVLGLTEYLQQHPNN